MSRANLGLTAISLRNESRRSPERNRTAMLKSICAVSVQRKDPMRAHCCIALPLSAASGRVEDARSAGARPNRMVLRTLSAAAKAND